MELSGQKIIITGATGFIGSHVAGSLLAEGAEIFALVREESNPRGRLTEHPRLHLVPGSLAQIEKLAAAVGQADGFLHFAWGGVNRDEIDSPVVQTANVEASLACVRAARELGCQVFMDAGSRVEYGITADGTMTETMACRPVNAYGKAKLAFYQQAKPLCEQWGITYYHLRFFSVYGTGDHPWSVVSTLVRDLPQGKTVSLSACRHRWNFMNIADAARAVLLLYQFAGAVTAKGESHIVNIASRDSRVLRDYVEEIWALCGRQGKLEFGTFTQAGEGALSLCPTVGKLTELTAGTYREQVTFAAGIRRMLAAEEEIPCGYPHMPGKQGKEEENQ